MTPHSRGGNHLPGALSRLAVGGVGLGAFNALLARAGRSVCRRLEPNAQICSRARLQRGKPAGAGSADETAEARDDGCYGRLGQRRRRWCTDAESAAKSQSRTFSPPESDAAQAESAADSDVNSGYLGRLWSATRV